MKSRFLTFAVLALAIWTVGCSTPRDQPVFAPIPGELVASLQTGADSHTRRLLVVGDRIAMTFTGLTNTNLPPIDQIVGEDGTIELPLIGKLVAAGKTLEQLRGDILNAIIPHRNPRLRSWFAPFEQFFFVQGQVKQPGRYPYSGELTVAKAIDTAGGFIDFADRKQVRLIREGDAYSIINWNKIEKNPSLDPRVLPGDQIVVPLRKWTWPFGK